MKNNISVSNLVDYLKKKNDNDINLLNINIIGEISNFKYYQGRNIYFDLKDKDAIINVVIYQMYHNNLIFKPQNGDKVIVEGSIKVFKNKASFQIQASNIHKYGIGDLYIEFEKNKKLLASKGYFALEHKKNIVKFPNNIAVIAGNEAAALHDILKTINNRYKLSKVFVFTSLVQGKNASQNIISNIKLINSLAYHFDTIIIARGGGSFEDLNAFNDLNLAITVYHSKIPIITGVGHENDTTLIDYVADLRALTPTDAAIKATPNTQDLMGYCASVQNYLKMAFFKKLNSSSQLIDYHHANIVYKHKNRLNNYHKQLHYYLNVFNKNKFYNLVNSYFQKIYLNNMKMNNSIKYCISKNDIKIDTNFHTLSNNYNNILNNKYLLLKTNHQAIINNFTKIIKEKKQLFDRLYYQLCLLDPKNIMNKGYAIVKKDHNIVKSFKTININDKISVINNSIELVVNVEEVNKNE
ncbi:MAG: exodeoxyribonuclease VII large subunit [Bacilli bacterium]|nr:exodeoxyribonuclease VII large subunit [Bacilli bacterium]